MKKILLITNIPTPYRIPLFNELNKQLTSAGFRLKVVFAALGYSRRKWKIDVSGCNFDYLVLPEKGIFGRKKENLIFSFPGLNSLIDEEDPFLVITSAFSIATMKLWLRSFYRPINYIIWSGSISGSNHGISAIRRIQRKLLISRASGFVAYGSKAKDNLVELGAPEEKVHIAINTVDTGYFLSQSEKWKGALTDGKTRFVYVGHLTKGKRIDFLLRAAHTVKKSSSNFFIDIVGDGPEYGDLYNLVVALGLEENVSFEGYKQRDEIPRYMGRADCFVFPSEYDIWGLVLVEAMASGIPCLSSIMSGATRDIVIGGETGFPIDFNDTEVVAENMLWIMRNPDEVRSMGLVAREFIEHNANLGISARGFVDAISGICNR